MADWQHWQHILVYGGTFDPPHCAHARLPRHVAEVIGCDGVLYIPAGRPPHKPDSGRTPGHHRLAMLELALGSDDRLAIWDYELEQAGPSYTVRTLEALREKIGRNVKLRLLMGMDMALIFDQWMAPRRIEEIAEPVVMVRPPDDQASFLGKIDSTDRPRWSKRVIEIPPFDVSSRQVRQALADRGVDDPYVAAYLSGPVRDYITEHHLYGVR